MARRLRLIAGVAAVLACGSEIRIAAAQGGAWPQSVRDAVDAALADFPCTPSEVDACRFDYQIAMGSVNRTPAELDRAISGFKKCVTHDRLVKKAWASAHPPDARVPVTKGTAVAGAPTATQESAPPQPAAEKRAVAEKKPASAERQRKRAEKRSADVEANQLVDEGFCGKPPEKLGNSYLGAENIAEQAANDPGSVDFVACSDAIKEPMPACWTTYCKFRAKNGFGALVLEIRKFSKSSIGWRIAK